MPYIYRPFSILSFFYIASFIYSKPTIETDYVAQFMQLNKSENFNPEDNAWPYYEKAFELFVEPDSLYESDIHYQEDSHKDLADYNSTQQKIIEEWIEQNQPAWQQFLIASSKPYCKIDYSIQEPDKDDLFYNYHQVLDIPTMKLGSKAQKFRNLSYFFKWQIKLQLERANTEQAIDDCFAMLNSGFNYLRERFYSIQILGLSYQSIGNEELLNIISQSELSLNELEEIQKKLTDLYQNNPIKFNLDAEKIMFMDIIQHVFTKGPFGRGHLIPKYLPALIQPAGIIVTMSKLNPEPTDKEKLSFLLISLLHARRNKTIAKYNKVFEQMNEIQNMSPYEQKITGYSMDIEKPFIFNLKLHLRSFTKQSKYLLVNIYALPMDRISKLIYEKKAEYEATITILALKRYFHENASYPENLQELLTKAYITKLPIDPYSDKSLVYKKVDNDFTLYSYGEDFEENNGTPLFSGELLKKWGYSQGKKEGDAVFWPVPKYNKELTRNDVYIFLKRENDETNYDYFKHTYNNNI